MKKLLFILLILLSFTSFSQTKKYYQSQSLSLSSKVDSLILAVTNLKASVNDYKIKGDEKEKNNSELKTTIKALEQAVQDLKKENELLKKDIASRNSVNSDNVTDKKQCSAFNSNGTRCTQQAAPESTHCSEHNVVPSIKNASSSTPSQSSGSSDAGRTIYTGPRGGKYYINGNGKKTYIK